jgi:hypothetical protein
MEKVGIIIWLFGIYVPSTAIWYIHITANWLHFSIFSPVLVYCVEKHLATLVPRYIDLKIFISSPAAGFVPPFNCISPVGNTFFVP